MEEDIMILESECYYLEELGYLRENNHFIRFNQALKNLIKGYKLEKLKNVLDEQNLKESLEDYIPKSKFREKMEELDNMIKEINKRKTSKVHSRRDYSFKEIFTRTYGGIVWKKM